MLSKKAAITTFFLLLFLFPAWVSAQNHKTGFARDTVWFSQDPFSSGDKIKIYASVQNYERQTLYASVLFFSNQTLLGKREVVVPPEQTKISTIDWTASAGNYTFYAKIENPRLLTSPGTFKKIAVESSTTSKITRLVGTPVASKFPSTEKLARDGFESIRKIGNLIVENTPDVVAKPIISAIQKMERWRHDAALKISREREKARGELKALNTLQVSLEEGSDKESIRSQLKKPFVNLKLFIFSLILFILNSSIFFYGLLAFLLLKLLRFLLDFIP